MYALLRSVAYAALRCPICRCELSTTGRSLGCGNRHNFDFAKSGYVNLTRGQRRKPAAGGDTRLQLQHRDTFLSSGAFDFIADTILARWQQDVRASVLLLLDAGCGTGYHLSRIAHGLQARIGRPCGGLGVDLSKEATQIAARHHKAFAFAVTDVWSEWPIRSGSVDFLTSVFAPKNFREMARALRSDGRIAVAYPGPHHLIELRRQFALMRMGGDKKAVYRDRMSRFFGNISQDHILRNVQITHRDALSLILMGPNARHPTEGGIPAWPGTRSVTFDVELLFASTT